VTGESGMGPILAIKPAGKRPICGRRCRVLRISPSWLLVAGMTLVGGAALIAPSAACQTTPPASAAHPSTSAAQPSSSATQPTPGAKQPPSSATTSSARPKRHKKPEVAPVAVPPQPTVAPSLLEQPATPATVSAHNNELTVKADNSSLSQILHQISSATGMKLDGLGGDERVFGSFGPGAPREVLTSLLNGTSYNILMVGDLPNGAPRQLLLSNRAGGAPPPPANANANQNQTHTGDEDNPDDTASPDDSDDTSPPMQYTPPSIAPAEPPPTNGPSEASPTNGPSEAPPRPMPQTQSEPQ
jgi:hypothetical protein